MIEERLKVKKHPAKYQKLNQEIQNKYTEAKGEWINNHCEEIEQYVLKA